MQTKITMKYHLTPIRMTIIKKLQTINVVIYVEKREPSFMLIEMWIGTATMESSMEIPQETRNNINIWPSSPITGHTPWEKYDSKRHKYPTVNFLHDGLLCCTVSYLNADQSLLLHWSHA